jgi:hypothetical protein
MDTGNLFVELTNISLTLWAVGFFLLIVLYAITKILKISYYN